MIPGTPPTRVYTDLQSLAGLKKSAREQSPEALREAATQFEAVFMQMMLSSMRAASPGDGGLLDNDQSDLYRDLFDRQIALNMADKGQLGLADLIVKQLGGTPAPPPAPVSNPVDLLGLRPPPPPPARALSTPPARSNECRPEAEIAPVPPGKPFKPSTKEAFVEHMWPYAQQAARRIGQVPEVLIAQAALESAWGRFVPRAADGTSSHNLFGIKADKSWSGDRVRNLTLEFIDGVAVKRRDGFRAYDSYAESFNDYANFLQRNPRYGKALNMQGDPVGFARALQAAGYATDPSYAAKIEAILKGPVRAVLNELKTTGDKPIPFKG